MKKHHWIAIFLPLVFLMGCAANGGESIPAASVDATVPTARPDVVRTVYEPETGLVAPPSVVLKVETREQYQLLGGEHPPQAAWFVLDDGGKEIILGEERLALADAFSTCYGKIIPFFELKTVTAAQFLQSFSKQSRTMDFLVISDTPEVLKEIDLTGVRKALITNEKGAACAWQVHEAGADIAVLSEATRVETEYLQLRLISVLLRPHGDSEAAGRSAVACGANHVAVSDHDAVYRLYEQITEPKTFVRRPFIAAHRGVPNVAPENSVESFLEAVKAGADAVECDVYLTADGHLAIHHDETLKRTTVEKTGAVVESLTREELKSYTLSPVGAYSDCKIAFLDEFYDLMRDNSIHLIVEVKSKNPECVAKIRELTERYGMLDRINIISFNFEQVLLSRQMMPEVGAALIVNVGNNPADKLLRSAYAQTAGANGAYCPSQGFSGEGVRAMQHRGIPVNLWTVDGLEDMVAAAERGIAILTTNTTTDRIFVDLVTAPVELALPQQE